MWKARFELGFLGFLGVPEYGGPILSPQFFPYSQGFECTSANTPVSTVKLYLHTLQTATSWSVLKPKVYTPEAQSFMRGWIRERGPTQLGSRLGGPWAGGSQVLRVRSSHSMGVGAGV